MIRDLQYWHTYAASISAVDFHAYSEPYKMTDLLCLFDALESEGGRYDWMLESLPKQH